MSDEHFYNSMCKVGRVDRRPAVTPQLGAPRRQVVMRSSSAFTLTACGEGISSLLLFPFRWQLLGFDDGVMTSSVRGLRCWFLSSISRSVQFSSGSEFLYQNGLLGLIFPLTNHIKGLSRNRVRWTMQVAPLGCAMTQKRDSLEACTFRVYRV